MKSPLQREDAPVTRFLRAALLALTALHFALSLLRYYALGAYIAAIRVEEWIALLLLPLGWASRLLAVRSQRPARPSLRLLLRESDALLAAAFVLWFIVCCRHAGRANPYNGNYWKANDLYLFNTCMAFFALTPLARQLGDRWQETLRVFAAALVLALAAIALLVLWRVFHGQYTQSPDGELIGMTRDARLRFGADFNFTGLYGMALAFLSLYLLASARSLWAKCLYGACGLIHLACMLLSNSRGSLLSCMAGGCVLALAVCWQELPFRPALRLLCGLAGCLLCAALLMAARAGVYRWLDAAAPVSAQYAQPGAAQPSSTEDQPRSLAEGVDTGFNGRDEIWRACWEILTESRDHLLYGVTPTDLSEAITRKTVRRVYHAHNQFLQAAVTLGVPGFLLYTLWMLRLAVASLRVLFARRGQRMPERVLPILLLAFAVASLNEASILFYHTLAECVFFLAAGWVLRLERTLA